MRIPLVSLLVLATAATSCGAGAQSTDDASARDVAHRGDDAGSSVVDAIASDDRASSLADVAQQPVADAAQQPVADPLTAPPRTWTWVDFPTSHCADGTPTGLGVNLAPGSDDVMVFLQGGGACWDAASCWGAVSTSFYIATGYSQAAFATDILRPAMLPLRRDDPANPFRDVNLVYVPYCTGDVHAGDHVVDLALLGVTHRTYFQGYRNLGLFLQRIVATFPRAHRVWLAGDSAGGFGAALNLDRVQRVFPSARVDVLDDSGQPIAPDPTRWSQWRAAWNLQVPDDCATCATDVGAFVGYYRGKYPANRFGLISYTDDAVITTFMGLLPTTFYRELESLASDMDAHWPTGRYYFLPGTLHVGLAAPTPGLIQWIDAMVSDDPHWSSQRPF